MNKGRCVWFVLSALCSSGVVRLLFFFHVWKFMDQSDDDVYGGVESYL